MFGPPGGFPFPPFGPLGGPGGPGPGGPPEFGPPIKPNFADIPYASKSLTQKLDILLPKTGDGPFTPIMWVHGGAFKMGDKTVGATSAEGRILSRGFAVVSVDYRLSGEACFPAAILDVKAAVRFIRANGSKYKLRTDKIGAWGASAGGNLVALLGTSADHAAFDDPELGNPGVSSTVQAVCDWFGPIDFLTMDEQFVQLGITPLDDPHDDPNSPESQYVGGPIQTLPEKCIEASPLTYISRSSPPFLIWHGKYDPLVPMLQSYVLYLQLVEAIGKDKTTVKFVDSGHGDMFTAPGKGPFSQDSAVDEVAAFFAKHLNT